MYIIIPTDNCFPLGMNHLCPDAWVTPIQYDSPQDFLHDYLADETQFLFNRDFEVWILNIQTGECSSFWSLLDAHKQPIQEQYPLLKNLPDNPYPNL